MTPDKNAIIPSETETLAIHEQRGTSWEKGVTGTDTTKENTKEWVCEALDLSTFMVPDPEIWGDTVSVTEEPFSLWTEQNESILQAAIDPATFFEIDREAIEASLKQDIEPKPVREVDTSDMPEINYDFDVQPAGFREKTPVVNIPPPDASIEELIQHGIQIGLDQGMELPEIGILPAVSDVAEPEKPWVSPDPFEQENPRSALEWKHGYYITQFRKIFERTESGTIEQSVNRYAKILLYILNSFHIGGSAEQKENIILTLYGELRDDTEMAEKYERFVQELKIRKNGGILPKKIYPVLNDSEKEELKRRYMFYSERYKILKQQIRDNEIEQQRIEGQVLAEKINAMEQETHYALSIKQIEARMKQEKEDTVNSELKRIVETIARPLYEKEMQRKVFTQSEILSIWKNIITPHIRKETNELMRMIVDIAMDELREKAKIINTIPDESGRKKMEDGILIRVTKRLVREYNLSSIVQNLFDAGIAGEIQRKEEHGKRLKNETDVTVLVHK